jgi:cellulose synthase/poly-beta-1,6-N-acetylglucosamine synthase-like glycosyltransferase
MELLFFGALGIVLLYPYLIYPAILASLTRRCAMPPPIDRDAGGLEQKTVSMLLAVHDEERVIADKVRNFLGQEYPEDHRELIVVSDGSTDGTEQIMKSIRHPRVKLLVQQRAGKTAALNAAAEIATGKIFVFTDANTMFAPDTLSQLVRHFADGRVGLVSGQAISGEQATSEGLYLRFERYLKTRESRLGVVAGADGAIYALRAELWKPLDRAVINDFVHPIHVALAGLRSAFDPNALATEPPTEDMRQEFARQKRMAAQAFGVLCRKLWPLARKGKLLALWVLISHRLLRWVHTPTMAICLLALVYLGWTREALWLHLVVAGYVAALVVGRLESSHRGGRLFRLFYNFELVHLAYFFGVLALLRGRTNVTWNPRGGAPSNA